jgi:minor extracellular serine protease Vpr
MQKKPLRFVLVTALVALIVAVPAALGGAANGTSVSAAEAEGGNLWFVELNTTPAKFRANANAAGIKFQQRFEYKSLWKGVSIRMSGSQVDDLKDLAGVKAVYPVVRMNHVPTAAASPELATALNMTGANTVQSEMGYTGEGVKVAIMDTGIDHDHPDLGGNGTPNDPANFPNDRVITGKDFVGDAFTGENQPSPGPTPDDCNGHGTHVAGIVGANGATTGVAPDVQFGAYKVFGCEGFTHADIMIAAMEQAEADGMDVLNMSIGSAFMTWPQYPTAAAASALADRGMVVVASIGNSGANGVYSAGAPGVGTKVIGVASFDNSHISALTFRTNPADTQMPYLQLGGSAEAPTSGTTAEVVYVGRGCPVDPGFTPPDFEPDPYLADPAGKVALVDRGLCSFNGKYQRAVDAGAVGVVVANNAAGLFSGGAIVNRGYFAVGISLADGNTLKSQISSGPVTLTWTSDRVNAVNPAGGLISSFSSYGMTAELDLKPDIGAPGGLIRAPYPLEKQGGYAILSGTSMSSPHVAGTAALLLQARPGLNWEQVRTALQNTADPRVWSGNPPLGFLDILHRQGAGMVQIDRAIRATTSITPSKWAVNYLNAGPVNAASQTFTLTNSGTSDVTYSVSHVGAIGTQGDANAPGFFLGGYSVGASAGTVTVPAGESATIDLSINIPSPVLRRAYGGYFVFTKQGGTAADTLRVPYAGFQGNYLDIRVLEPTANEFPWLTKLADGSYWKQDEGAVYTMRGGDIPHVIAHFRHQSRRLELVLLDARTNQPVTPRGNVAFRSTVVHEDYLRRNSTAGSIFAYAWDGRIEQATRGTVVRRAMPDGQYKLQLRVLKALGDASIADHWETWTSPMFRIAR